MHDGTDMLGTKSLAVKIADENIVSGSLLTVEIANCPTSRPALKRFAKHCANANLCC